MGIQTVTRQYPACSDRQLQAYFQNDLEEMAREGGADNYCGNWNACNHGLHITGKKFAKLEDAKDWLRKSREKNDSVLAVQVGNFDTMWPQTKAQKSLVEKQKALHNEQTEFDYRILERAKKQKSKTKKCSKCESAIAVAHIPMPAVSDVHDTTRVDMNSGNYWMGRYMNITMRGLTDCPVCGANLLKTDTDVKNEASLKKRVQEFNKKVHEEQAAHQKAMQGKPSGFWLVSADCGD